MDAISENPDARHCRENVELWPIEKATEALAPLIAQMRRAFPKASQRADMHDKRLCEAMEVLCEAIEGAADYLNWYVRSHNADAERLVERAYSALATMEHEIKGTQEEL